jgi:hypothetical protein
MADTKQQATQRRQQILVTFGAYENLFLSNILRSLIVVVASELITDRRAAHCKRRSMGSVVSSTYFFCFSLSVSLES